MTTPHLLHPDYEAAIKSMPRNRDGHVVDLHYVPAGQVEALEAEWREWCRTHPNKQHWPRWIFKWADAKRRGVR